MLAMLTGLSGFLSSSSSRMDASSATTTTLQQGSINSASVVRTNNNKAVSFKSQSPSEDKTIHLYSGLALPCETDHMYANYPSEGKRELADEVSHLKALVLFHLDLIQQQSECNAAKDKQLTALKLENEMLRQRLERMERRVQLQNGKVRSDSTEEGTPAGLAKTVEPAVSSPQVILPGIITELRNPVKIEDSKVPANLTMIVPDQPAVVDPSDVVPKKRIKTLLPVRTKPTPSPTSKRKHANNNKTDLVDIKLDDNILDDLINQAVKEGAILNITDTSVASGIVESSKITLLPVKEEPTSDSTLPEHRRIQQLLSSKPPPREPSHLKKELILTTEEPYSTHVGDFFNQPESFSNQNHVEVPQWVIKPLSSRSASQGVENLDDEVFTKRHSKHEIDEKRRKRWDLQRIREQRQYEKLRARYEGEDRSLDRVRNRAPAQSGTSSNPLDPSSGIASSAAVVVTSLWATPEDVTHVQVEPWLPVAAFGAPLPNVTQSDFQLPWANNRSMELLYQARTSESSASKRRRRSCKAE